MKLKSEQNGSLEDTQCDPFAPGHRVRIPSPPSWGFNGADSHLLLSSCSNYLLNINKEKKS